MAQDKDDKRFINRRRMAWLSFILLAVTGSVLLYLGITKDGYAERIQALSFLIGSMFSVWGAVILAYNAATTFTHVADAKNQRVTTDIDIGEK